MLNAKILDGSYGSYINKDSKYYSLDSFFGFEIVYGVRCLSVVFHSKYGLDYDVELNFDPEVVFEDAKKEIEEMFEWRHVRYF